MSKQEELVVENMARVGYQTMHDSQWDNPEVDDIEMALWRTIAANMLYEIRRTWETAKNEYKLNPDYLDFDKGVQAGKIIQKERIRKLLNIPPDESYYCMWCSALRGWY